MLNVTDTRTEIAAATLILNTLRKTSPNTHHLVRIGKVNILTATTGATSLDPARMVETATAYLATDGKVYVTLGSGNALRPTRRDLPAGMEDGDKMFFAECGAVTNNVKGVAKSTLIGWVRAAAKADADAALAAVYAAA